jgi:hypothetical protein
VFFEAEAGTRCRFVSEDLFCVYLLFWYNSRSKVRCDDKRAIVNWHIFDHNVTNQSLLLIFWFVWCVVFLVGFIVFCYLSSMIQYLSLFYHFLHGWRGRETPGGFWYSSSITVNDCVVKRDTHLWHSFRISSLVARTSLMGFGDKILPWWVLNMLGRGLTYLYNICLEVYCRLKRCFSSYKRLKALHDVPINIFL